MDAITLLLLIVLMAVTTTALRDEVVRTTSAAAVLNELNNRLLARMKQTNMNRITRNSIKSVSV